MSIPKPREDGGRGITVPMPDQTRRDPGYDGNGRWIQPTPGPFNGGVPQPQAPTPPPGPRRR